MLNAECGMRNAKTGGLLWMRVTYLDCPDDLFVGKMACSEKRDNFPENAIFTGCSQITWQSILKLLTAAIALS